ncbi:MAG TPA: alpha/beta fold hydrolase, partial [Pseudoxanthomonas sp.]|nr:alpha/beta fold hydrolase [Pseudoxanthomonas sp.]
MAVRLTGVKTVAVLAAVFVCALAAWLWREPMGLINAEFARQRWMAGLEAHDITVAGHRIAYAERPAREPGAATVVMVHGFTGSKENWYPVASRLIGHYRVIALDLPGWGQSQRNYPVVADQARGHRIPVFLAAGEAMHHHDGRCRRIFRLALVVRPAMVSDDHAVLGQADPPS